MEYRIINKDDLPFLIKYFDGLSETTRSYYAPHPFDKSTLQAICLGNYPDFQAFIAIQKETIVGYAVIKHGYSDGE